ncbi:SIR2 family protein [Luteibacter sp. 3190]|uniref:SIR2 family NAD-dependent protein deacylase n=1 Tax=Luteibacter sp. 3190 TaxID=2817736 RepID=UPI0028550E07|nr:SIR2 family protein [Luteibacter sp. 3190]MDR6935344.1 hypothetical protein [Luteibacter sp. 3190]
MDHDLVVRRMVTRAFADAFALHPEQFAWLLGAGASASSRIPTGYDMILDFKRRIFCRETNLPPREVDPTDSRWAGRIKAFFAARNILPPDGDASEYAKAFEVYLPHESDRRRYIADKVALGVSSFAHKVIASLLVSEKTPCAFTTNFDNLVESTVALARHYGGGPNGKDLTVSAIDSVKRGERSFLESDWPLLVKLHGDFQSVELKNTERELAEQDETLRRILVDAGARFGLVIVGYSGRDASVMEALEEALNRSNPYPGGIYWCTPTPDQLLPAVTRFLERAAAADVRTHVVDSKTFDELAGDIAEVVDLPSPLNDFIRAGRTFPAARPAPLPNVEAQKTPVLRLSALPLGPLPAEARRLRLTSKVSLSDVRKRLRERGAPGVIARAGEDFALFGPDSFVREALDDFGVHIAGTIPLLPERDAWSRGLLYDALILALCRQRPLSKRLRGNGHQIVIAAANDGDSPAFAERKRLVLASLRTAYGRDVVGLDEDTGWPFAEGIRVRLDQAAGRWWCVFDPFTHIDVPSHEVIVDTQLHRVQAPADLEKAGSSVRERWAMRYNKQWGVILDAWASLLTAPSGRIDAFWMDGGDGINATFEIGSFTGWSRPSHTHPLLK